MATIAILGTMDTKGEEHAFVAEQIKARGHQTLVIDVGALEAPKLKPDITREEVCRAAGADYAALLAKRDRGESVAAMSKGAPIVLAKLVAASDFDGTIRTLRPKASEKTALAASPGSVRKGALEVVLQTGENQVRVDHDYEPLLASVLFEEETVSRVQRGRAQAFAPIQRIGGDRALRTRRRRSAGALRDHRPRSRARLDGAALRRAPTMALPRRWERPP